MTFTQDGGDASHARPAGSSTPPGGRACSSASSAWPRTIGHTINSAWFRLAGGLDLEDWGRDDAEWMGKMSEPRHAPVQHQPPDGRGLLGVADPALHRGRSGSASCADPRFHPFERDQRARAHDGLARAGTSRSSPPRSSRGSTRSRTSCGSRTSPTASSGSTRPTAGALVGEAGAFADPFYSPGSDFIGYGNTFTTDLIARDLDGEDISERARVLQRLLPPHLRLRDLEATRTSTRLRQRLGRQPQALLGRVLQPHRQTCC